MQSLDKDSKANCLSWLSCNKKNNSLVQKKNFFDGEILLKMKLYN